MTGCQIEVFLTAKNSICLPLSLAMFVPAKSGEFGVAGDTHIEIVNHGDQGRFSADGIVDARSRRSAHSWLLPNGPVPA